MNRPPEVKRFESRADLNVALAGEIVAGLAEAVNARGVATFVASGGSTPGPLYDVLSEMAAPWRSVQVTLSDERWVDPDDPRSNERLVRGRLLRDLAAGARFTPLKTGHAEPEDAEAEVDAALRALPRPFDIMLLGLGENGHTASLFPHGQGLSRALDVSDPALARAVRPVPPDDPDPPRMSMSLRALLDSRLIILLFTGQAKWKTYEAAMGPGEISDAPARALLRQDQTPVQVWWAP